jgi:hypothetical protein
MISKARRGWSRGALPDTWEDDVSTFLFLALFSTFLLGMTVGAFTRRIID